MFIGCSRSNHSAFYLYRATKAGLTSTPYYSHARVSKGCGFCTVKSVTYISLVTKNIRLASCYFKVIAVPKDVCLMLRKTREENLKQRAALIHV